MSVAGRMPRLAGTTADAVLALGISALGVLETAVNPRIEPRAAAAACEVAIGLALVGRRRTPLATMVVVALASTAEALAGVPLQEPLVPLIASVVALYSLVSYAPARDALTGVVIGVAALATQTAVQHKGVGNFLFGLVFLLAAWVAGRAIHARAARAEQLERDQHTREAAAAEQERRRIARELHDIVSHNLAVLVVQAGAVEQILDRDPERAREVLRSMRATGHEAIAEMGTLLSLARGEEAGTLHPQPGLGELDALIERTRAAGLPVELVVEGERRELSPALELSAYRIIQEGLTNALKHARGRRAHVMLRYGRDHLAVEVTDDGDGTASGEGARRGLAGIRERVAVYGGSLEAGARPEGGWTLRASLPL